ncbi:uncharacterized protein LOC129580251 [Sitodiplosis mosellana]|uniref:uncharacterized protein LOC129580251 n=1 Tax=Sitodiplosis mosellana TaxID=263140 RepID=UPI0024448D9A|nr:uncharacterized protein LOC129580251 [Sitodiplosis mosellana]
MEFRNINEDEIPKENIFRSIFNTEYNLSFKKRHTDTCKTCDEMKTKFQSRLTSTARKNELEKEKEKHLSLVERTNASFRNDIEAAIESKGKTAVLTFDLQKTLETPSLTTSVVFYKRQLWTYNLCVYDEIEKKGYMYVWAENIASRGGQEVGSCLIKHLNNHISNETTKIILNSDSCPGQNRNIKLTLFLKKFLSEHSTVESIEQKFFVSGHSYNSCDRCFSLIEKRKRFTGDVYTPDDWIKVISESKVSEPKFEITKMLPEDFISSEQLEKMIVNRKKDVQKVKINWNHFRKILYLKNDLFHIIVEEKDTWKHIDIQKRGIDETEFCETPMECLYPNGNEINQKKFDDLMELLKFIPSKHHSFYHNLIPARDAIDFGLASDSEDESYDDDVIIVDDE